MFSNNVAYFNTPQDQTIATNKSHHEKLTPSAENQREDLECKDMGSIFVNQNPWSLGSMTIRNQNQTTGDILLVRDHDNYESGNSIFCTKNEFDEIGSPTKQENLAFRNVLLGEFEEERKTPMTRS